MSIRPRPYLGRLVPLAAVAALGLALVPATAAHAVGDAPVVTYIDNAHNGQLWTQTTNNGVDPATFDTATAVSTTAYPWSFDASEDGSVLAVAAQAAPNGAYYTDATYGLVLAKSDGTRRVLSTYFDSNAVGKGDGSAVYWFIGPAIWKYDDETGVA